MIENVVGPVVKRFGAQPNGWKVEGSRLVISLLGTDLSGVILYYPIYFARKIIDQNLTEKDTESNDLFTSALYEYSQNWSNYQRQSGIHIGQVKRLV